jgi:hypothetical protein
MNPPKDNTLIYIAADSRSGSTLLDLLIGNHSQIISVGELRQLHAHFNGNLTCTCDTLFSQCPFWNDVEQSLKVSSKSLKTMQTLIPKSVSVIQDINYFLPNFILRPLSKKLSSLTQNIKIAQNNLDVIDAICKTSGVQYIVDSSKVFKFGRLYNLLRPSSTKTIFLARDGRGVCYSRQKDGMSFRSSSKVWAAGQIKFLLLKLCIPRNNKLTVFYEQLCENPGQEMQRICQFIGVPFEPNCIELIKTDRHNVCGNPMRFETAETKIKLDEKWKTALSGQDHAVFQKSIPGLINKLLGYR